MFSKPKLGQIIHERNFTQIVIKNKQEIKHPLLHIFTTTRSNNRYETQAAKTIVVNYKMTFKKHIKTSTSFIVPVFGHA